METNRRLLKAYEVFNKKSSEIPLPYNFNPTSSKKLIERSCKKHEFFTGTEMAFRKLSNICLNTGGCYISQDKRRKETIENLLQV